MQTPDYYGDYYRLREDIILPPTPIYRGGYTKRDSLYTRGRLATALRWTAYGLRHGCRHVGVYRLHAR